MTRVRTYKSKAQQVAWCDVCQDWKGVMPGAPSMRSYNRKEPRIARHNGPTGRVCTTSGFTLPDGLVMDR